jgi:CrcB protein
VLNLLTVFIGGGIGAFLRYMIDVSIELKYPIAMLIINYSGSFLLGMLTSALFVKNIRSWLKAGLGTGLCGGFTSMSAFSADTFLLFEKSSLTAAVIYVALSVLGGIALAFLGMWLGSLLRRHSNERSRWT